MARTGRKSDVWRPDDNNDLDSDAGRVDAVPQRSAVGWPFPLDWRNVKPQTQRDRLANIEDAPF